VAAALGAAAVALAGCADSQRDEPSAEGGGESSGAEGGTFVFAGSSDPSSLDPAFASDGETFRPARQIFEGLVGTKPGTADPAPLLATEWETAEDGLSTTFTLRDDVTFHDGETFDAEAVCANFDRWYNCTGLLQSENLSYYYGKLFRGFADTDPKGIYESCTAEDATTATITLNKPFAAFVQAMSLPAFAMQSPKAMEQYDADNVGGTADDPASASTPRRTRRAPARSRSRSGSAASSQPAAATTTTGGQAKVDKVISGHRGRQRAPQALVNGEIDGYDLVRPVTSRGWRRTASRSRTATLQHPLPGLQPGRAGAAGPQGPPGHRARHRQGRRGQPVAARGQRGRGDLPARAVAADRGRPDLRVRPGEGQGAAAEAARRA
jgi:peptide/nickel transport system substrate-binding protein